MELGFDEVGDRSTITFVEWGDAIAQLLPADYLEVDLRHTDGIAGAESVAGDTQEETRVIELRAHGPDWRRRMDRLADDLARWLDGGAD
jgi:tRNA threonylcarbamoyladenosine biosynthesis protein TsaE